MKKFAANYLISKNSSFLKNGIVSADENGNALEFIDTNGNLREIELLEFHNGIIITGVGFRKTKPNESENQDSIVKPFLQLDSIQLPVFIDLLKLIQNHFPEEKLPFILNMAEEQLHSAGFEKIYESGIFLLSGINLPELKLTAKTRLKKIA